MNNPKIFEIKTIIHINLIDLPELVYHYFNYAIKVEQLLPVI